MQKPNSPNYFLKYPESSPHTTLVVRMDRAARDADHLASVLGDSGIVRTGPDRKVGSGRVLRDAVGSGQDPEVAQDATTADVRRDDEDHALDRHDGRELTRQRIGRLILGR